MSRLTEKMDNEKLLEADIRYLTRNQDGIYAVLNKLGELEDLEEQGRLIITDEPRKPLIAGEDTLYCPECGSDLMGGFPYTDDAEMFQCRYCGQWINETEQPIKLAELKGTEE